MPKVPAPRARRTKQEVDKEYSKIVEEVAEPKGTASAKAADFPLMAWSISVESSVP